jgi:hypothetical protein
MIDDLRPKDDQDLIYWEGTMLFLQRINVALLVTNRCASDREASATYLGQLGLHVVDGSDPLNPFSSLKDDGRTGIKNEFVSCVSARRVPVPLITSVDEAVDQ